MSTSLDTSATAPDGVPGSGDLGRPPLLAVRDLSVTFPTDEGPLAAVSELSYTVERGRTLGIVGESGSGKSVSSMAVLGLHDPKRTRISGSIEIDGTEVVGLGDRDLRRLRGDKVAMVFQDALTSLHPFYKIGRQLVEAYRLHHPRASGREARDRALDMLDRVGIAQPRLRLDDFPHQFSGGMRQRVMIAMALMNDPSLLIADEPTTALDVTVQAQILDLLQELQAEHDAALVIITHDLGVIAEVADDVLVMYAGRAVEYGTARDILSRPEMPYTWGLLSSVPEVDDVSDARLVPIPGAPPNMADAPTGCAFHPRCVHVAKVTGDRCVTELPLLLPGRTSSTHLRRCHLEDPDAIYQQEVLPEVVGEIAPSPVTLPYVEGASLDPETIGDAPGDEPFVAVLEAVAEPHAPTPQPDAGRAPILEVRDLQMYFPVRSAGLVRRVVGHVRAVDGVSFQVPAGASLGLVGESGCGKSTLGRLITRLYRPTAGAIDFDGHDLAPMSERQLHPLRREVQMIFQDPYASLNPRHTIGGIVATPLIAHRVVPKSQILGRVQELLEVVGLNPEHYDRYPNEFSGGQRQRIGIARALALNPKLLVADEPVSALDVSIQAQVVNLLQDLQREFDIAFLFIAHDLAVVRHFCPEVAVMYLGKIVEIGDRASIYRHAQHPYTQALLSAVPDVAQAAVGGRRERIRLQGDVPSPIDPPSGCRFRTRCAHATDLCARSEPPLLQIGPRHKVACHYPGEIGAHPAEPVDTSALTALPGTGPGYDDTWIDPVDPRISPPGRSRQ